jgi:L-fuculose-phosphate aldolase
MLLAQERAAVVRYGRKLVAAGLTAGTGGNLSCRSPETGMVAISPSGMDYGEIVEEDVAVLSPSGEVVEGRRKPSSEWAMHLEAYRARPDAGGVVHTHSPFATVLACLGWEIPPVHYLVGFAGKRVPCIPYVLFGTDELARSAASALGEGSAVLLGNHGLLAVGSTLSRAFATAEEIEFVAQVYYRTRCVGEPRILSEGEMEPVLAKFAAYGQQ